MGTGAKLDVTWPADKKIGRANVGAGNAQAVISGPETIRTITTPKKNSHETGVANEKGLIRIEAGNKRKPVCLLQVGVRNQHASSKGLELVCLDVEIQTGFFASSEGSKPACLM